MPPRKTPGDKQEAHFYDTTLLVRFAGERDVGQKRKGHEEVEYQASAFVLVHYSPYFKRALSKDWGGDEKRLEVTVDSLETFEHLLEYMHSMGKALPKGIDKVHLLSLAHEYGVEECITAVASALADEASDLSLEACNMVLTLACGRECEAEAAVAALGGLRRAIAQRLLQLLGKLDDMMNDAALLRDFCQLHPTALEELFALDELNVEYEETVFCAFAHWMHAHDGMDCLEKKVVAASILPLIRFASMQCAIVATYWHAYQWFREFDAGKDILAEALVYAADPLLAEALLAKAKHAQAGNDPTPARLKRRPSVNAQASWQLSFVSKVDVGTENSILPPLCYGASHYAAGLWWAACVDTRQPEEGLPKADIGLRIKYHLPPGVQRALYGQVGGRSVGAVVRYTITVGRAQNGQATTVLTPLLFDDGSVTEGWPNFVFKARMPNGSPIHRSTFRSAGSPIVQDGKMLVRVSACLKAHR